ncbi:MAG: hypothetical protein ABIQ31_09745 [Ferruginibacter sp.]
MNILSLLTPEEVSKAGKLSPEVICGMFESKEPDPAFFRENKIFVDFMHYIIETKGNELPSLNEAAKDQKNGYLYLVDFRTPEGIMGNVPPEDIIGAFTVENGEIVQNSYQQNTAHKIYTKNGLVKLPPGLHELFIEALIKINSS